MISLLWENRIKIQKESICKTIRTENDMIFENIINITIRFYYIYSMFDATYDRKNNIREL